MIAGRGKARPWQVFCAAQCLWSAIIRSSTGGREEVFVMQSAEDSFGADRVRFSTAMA
jgi:hypothetical protein